MTERSPKPPEVIQAQIAAFTAERVPDRKDQQYIFNNIGTIAVGDTQDVTRVLSDAEYHDDKVGNPVKVPEGTLRTAATAENYTGFLRNVGGLQYESIRERANILGAYKTFESQVTKLRRELAVPALRQLHPDLLGGGLASMVFRIKNGGREYAVRVPSGPYVQPKIIDTHLGGAVLGKGIPHLEQIVAASYEDGVTVAEIMPGKEVDRLSIEEMKQITDEQLEQLVNTLVTVNARGIEIDPKSSNFFYDSKAGFGIIDYHSAKRAGKNSRRQHKGTVVGWGAVVVNSPGLYDSPAIPHTEAYYADLLNYTEVSKGLLERYRMVVYRALSGSPRRTALRFVDKRLAQVSESLTHYANPAWVARAVAEDQAWRNRQSSSAHIQRTDKVVVDSELI